MLAGLLVGHVSWVQGWPGWGVDACLTRHISDAEIPGYIQLLRSSGVRIVRERDVGVRKLDGSYGGDIRPRLRELKAAGFTVDAFATQAIPLRRLRTGDVLPEDLREVYGLGQVLRKDFAGLVDVWEMSAEPDIGYCHDLPDRLAAYEKALYLGLKSGNGRSPEAILGALALPPGPWLNRAAANGLLDYADAYNFHFYGHPEDLSGVLRAHRAFAKAHRRGPAELPIWITECGINAVKPDAFLDPARRRIQAGYTTETAQEALEGGAAVFMPFILVHHGDPAALTLSADQPLPAWNAYAAYTRAHPWPARPLAGTAHPVNPIILEWLPDNGAAIPHKVSGTYRFRGNEPMNGEIRVYNLGKKLVGGRLEAALGAGVRSTFPLGQEMVIAPGGLSIVHGDFSRERSGYVQAWWRGDFVGDDGSRSPLYFGLETTPQDAEFVETPLVLSAPGGRIQPQYPDYSVSDRAGPWVGINGVKVEAPTATGARFRVTQVTGDPGGDPFYPPMAIASLHGLPREGFLVVKPDRVPTDLVARVDFVDTAGQRFTIWENLGQSYTAPRKDLWLNLHDFHVYFWGHCTDDPRFRPENVRQMQLRFYFLRVPSAIGLDFFLARPRVSPES